MTKRKTLRFCIGFILIFALIAPVFTFLACQFGGETEREFSFERATFLYAQPQSSISQTMQAQRTMTNNANYYFVLISMDNMIETANKIEDLLDLLRSSAFPYFNLDIPRLNIHINNSFHLRADPNNNAVFARITDVRSDRFINFVLQAIVSNTINYGLLNGLSARIFRRLDWGNYANRPHNQLAYFVNRHENRLIKHLNFAAFNDRFANQLQQEYAHHLSIAFVDHLVLNNGNHKAILSQLLVYGQQFNASFDTLFYQHLNTFLESIGANEVVASTQVYRFFSYTHDYPIVLKTQSAYYFMHRDWEGEEFLGYSALTFLLGDIDFNEYFAFLNHLLDREHAFYQIRAFFGVSEDLIRAPIRLKELYSRYQDLWAPWQADYIYLQTIWPIIHAYAVFVMINTLGFISPHNWIVWALLNFCVPMFDNLVIDNLMILYSDRKNPEISDHEHRTLYLYEQRFGTIEYTINFINFSKILKYVALFELDHIFNLDYTYDSFVFLLYLKYTYGVQAIFEIYQNHGIFSGIVTDPTVLTSNFKAWLYDFMHGYSVVGGN